MAIDWEVAGHAIALGGAFIKFLRNGEWMAWQKKTHNNKKKNFMRIGEWKARQETRLSILERRQETYDNKIEELSRLISSQNNILTEVKVKLDLMCAEKNNRRINGEQRE